MRSYQTVVHGSPTADLLWLTAEQRTVVLWLRNKAGMKRRQGVLNGRRFDYFKGAYMGHCSLLNMPNSSTLISGSSAVKALLSPAYAKVSNVPKVTTEEEAKALLHSIIPHAFYLRVERQGALHSPYDRRSTYEWCHLSSSHLTNHPTTIIPTRSLITFGCMKGANWP